MAGRPVGCSGILAIGTPRKRSIPGVARTSPGGPRPTRPARRAHPDVVENLLPADLADELAGGQHRHLCHVGVVHLLERGEQIRLRLHHDHLFRRRHDLPRGNLRRLPVKCRTVARKRRPPSSGKPGTRLKTATRKLMRASQIAGAGRPGRPRTLGVRARERASDRADHARALFDEGIYVVGFSYPGGRPGARGNLSYLTRTVSTGQGAVAMTRAATMPRKKRGNPVRPCVPSTRTSVRFDLAARTMTSYGLPATTRPAARTPARLAFATSAPTCFLAAACRAASIPSQVGGGTYWPFGGEWRASPRASPGALRDWSWPVPPRARTRRPRPARNQTPPSPF